MPRTIKVRIPIIVTADGKWAVNGGHSHSEPDWSFIEEMCDYENPLVCPQRIFIIAELPVPEIGEVKAAVETE